MLNPMKFFQKQKAKLSVSKESVKKCCRCICRKATGFYDFLTKDGLNGRSFYNWKNLNTVVRQKGRTIMEMIAVILIIGLLTLGAIFLYRLSINHHHANQIVDDVERLAFTVHEKVQDIDKSDYAIDFAKRGIDFRKNSMYDIKAYKKSTDSFYIEVPGVLYSECVVLLPKAQEEAVSAFPENEDRPDRYIISVITKDKNGKYNEQFFKSGSSPKEICKAPTIQSSSEQTLTVRFYFAVQVGGDCEPCDPAQATKCCNGCFCDTSANYCATDVRSSFRPEKCCPKGTVACGGRCVSNSCPADKPFSEEKCMCDIKGNTVCIENMVEHCEEYDTASTSANCPCTRCETGYIEDNGACTLVECGNDPSETPAEGNGGLLGEKSLCNEYEAICNDQGVHPCKEWTCVVPSFIPLITAPEYKYYMIDKTAVYGEKGRPCPWKCASGYELASPTQCVPPLYPCVPPTTLNDCCILHDSKGDIVYGANGKPIDTYDRTARYRTQGVDCPCVSCRGSLSDCRCSLPKNYDPNTMNCNTNVKCIETCPCDHPCTKPPFAENPCKTGWDWNKCDYTGDCGEYSRPIDGQCKRPCTSRAPSNGSPWSVTVNGKSATCKADTMVYTSRTSEDEACPADPGYCPCTQFLCTNNANTCTQPGKTDIDADPGRNWYSVTSSASAPCERCLCKPGYKEDTTAAGCTAAGTCGKCVCTDVTHLNGAGCVEYNTHYTGSAQCPCTKWACVTDTTTCKLPTPEDKASDENRLWDTTYSKPCEDVCPCKGDYEFGIAYGTTGPTRCVKKCTPQKTGSITSWNDPDDSSKTCVGEDKEAYYTTERACPCTEWACTKPNTCSQPTDADRDNDKARLWDESYPESCHVCPCPGDFIEINGKCVTQCTEPTQTCGSNCWIATSENKTGRCLELDTTIYNQTEQDCPCNKWECTSHENARDGTCSAEIKDGAKEADPLRIWDAKLTTPCTECPCLSDSKNHSPVYNSQEGRGNEIIEPRNVMRCAFECVPPVGQGEDENRYSPSDRYYTKKGVRCPCKERFIESRRSGRCVVACKKHEGTDTIWEDPDDPGKWCVAEDENAEVEEEGKQCPCTKWICTVPETCARPSNSDQNDDKGRNWNVSVDGKCQDCECKSGFTEGTAYTYIYSNNRNVGTNTKVTPEKSRCVKSCNKTTTDDPSRFEPSERSHVEDNVVCGCKTGYEEGTAYMLANPNNTDLRSTRGVSGYRPTIMVSTDNQIRCVKSCTPHSGTYSKVYKSNYWTVDEYLDFGSTNLGGACNGDTGLCNQVNGLTCLGEETSAKYTGEYNCKCTNFACTAPENSLTGTPTCTAYALSSDTTRMDGDPKRLWTETSAKACLSCSCESGYGDTIQNHNNGKAYMFCKGTDCKTARPKLSNGTDDTSYKPSNTQSTDGKKRCVKRCTRHSGSSWQDPADNTKTCVGENIDAYYTSQEFCPCTNWACTIPADRHDGTCSIPPSDYLGRKDDPQRLWDEGKTSACSACSSCKSGYAPGTAYVFSNGKTYYETSETVTPRPTASSDNVSRCVKLCPQAGSAMSNDPNREWNARYTSTVSECPCKDGYLPLPSDTTPIYKFCNGSTCYTYQPGNNANYKPSATTRITDGKKYCVQQCTSSTTSTTDPGRLFDAYYTSAQTCVCKDNYIPIKATSGSATPIYKFCNGSTCLTYQPNNNYKPSKSRITDGKEYCVKQCTPHTGLSSWADPKDPTQVCTADDTNAYYTSEQPCPCAKHLCVAFEDMDKSVCSTPASNSERVVSDPQRVWTRETTVTCDSCVCPSGFYESKTNNLNDKVYKFCKENSTTDCYTYKYNDKYKASTTKWTATDAIQSLCVKQCKARTNSVDASTHYYTETTDCPCDEANGWVEGTGSYVGKCVKKCIPHTGMDYWQDPDDPDKLCTNENKEEYFETERYCKCNGPKPEFYCTIPLDRSVGECVAITPDTNYVGKDDDPNRLWGAKISEPCAECPTTNKDCHKCVCDSSKGFVEGKAYYFGYGIYKNTKKIDSNYTPTNEPSSDSINRCVRKCVAPGSEGTSYTAPNTTCVNTDPQRIWTAGYTDENKYWECPCTGSFTNSTASNTYNASYEKLGTGCTRCVASCSANTSLHKWGYSTSTNVYQDPKTSKKNCIAQDTTAKFTAADKNCPCTKWACVTPESVSDSSCVAPDSTRKTEDPNRVWSTTSTGSGYCTKCQCTSGFVENSTTYPAYKFCVPGTTTCAPNKVDDTYKPSTTAWSAPTNNPNETLCVKACTERTNSVKNYYYTETATCPCKDGFTEDSSGNCVKSYSCVIMGTQSTGATPAGDGTCVAPTQTDKDNDPQRLWTVQYTGTESCQKPCECPSGYLDDTAYYFKKGTAKTLVYTSGYSASPEATTGDITRCVKACTGPNGTNTSSTTDPNREWLAKYTYTSAQTCPCKDGFTNSTASTSTTTSTTPVYKFCPSGSTSGCKTYQDTNYVASNVEIKDGYKYCAKQCTHTATTSSDDPGRLFGAYYTSATVQDCVCKDGFTVGDAYYFKKGTTTNVVYASGYTASPTKSTDNKKRCVKACTGPNGTNTSSTTDPNREWLAKYTYATVQTCPCKDGFTNSTANTATTTTSTTPVYMFCKNNSTTDCYTYQKTTDYKPSTNEIKDGYKYCAKQCTHTGTTSTTDPSRLWVYYTSATVQTCVCKEGFNNRTASTSTTTSTTPVHMFCPAGSTTATNCRTYKYSTYKPSTFEITDGKEYCAKQCTHSDTTSTTDPGRLFSAYYTSDQDCPCKSGFDERTASTSTTDSETPVHMFCPSGSTSGCKTYKYSTYVPSAVEIKDGKKYCAVACTNSGTTPITDPGRFWGYYTSTQTCQCKSGFTVRTATSTSSTPIYKFCPEGSTTGCKTSSLDSNGNVDNTYKPSATQKITDTYKYCGIACTHSGTTSSDDPGRFWTGYYTSAETCPCKDGYTEDYAYYYKNGTAKKTVRTTGYSASPTKSTDAKRCVKACTGPNGTNTSSTTDPNREWEAKYTYSTAETCPCKENYTERVGSSSTSNKTPIYKFCVPGTTTCAPNQVDDTYKPSTTEKITDGYKYCGIACTNRDNSVGTSYYYTSSVKCPCKDGFVEDEDGNCVVPGTESQCSVACSSGSDSNADTTVTYTYSGGLCPCKSGYYMNSNGCCVNDPCSVANCTKTYGAYNTCMECESGYVLVESGRCNRCAKPNADGVIVGIGGGGSGGGSCTEAGLCPSIYVAEEDWESYCKFSFDSSNTCHNSSTGACASLKFETPYTILVDGTDTYGNHVAKMYTTSGLAKMSEAAASSFCEAMSDVVNNYFYKNGFPSSSGADLFIGNENISKGFIFDGGYLTNANKCSSFETGFLGNTTAKYWFNSCVPGKGKVETNAVCSTVSTSSLTISEDWKRDAVCYTGSCYINHCTKYETGRASGLLNFSNACKCKTCATGYRVASDGTCVAACQPEDGGCTLNASCCGGLYCGGQAPDDSCLPGSGKCKSIGYKRTIDIGGKQFTFRVDENGYVQYGTWFDAKNWCESIGLEMASAQDVGCYSCFDEVSQRYCATQATTAGAVMDPATKGRCYTADDLSASTVLVYDEDGNKGNISSGIIEYMKSIRVLNTEIIYDTPWFWLSDEPSASNTSSGARCYTLATSVSVNYPTQLVKYSMGYINGMPMCVGKRCPTIKGCVAYDNSCNCLQYACTSDDDCESGKECIFDHDAKKDVYNSSGTNVGTAYGLGTCQESSSGGYCAGSSNTACYNYLDVSGTEGGCDADYGNGEFCLFDDGATTGKCTKISCYPSQKILLDNGLEVITTATKKLNALSAVSWLYSNNSAAEDGWINESGSGVRLSDVVDQVGDGVYWVGVLTSSNTGVALTTTASKRSVRDNSEKNRPLGRSWEDCDISGCIKYDSNCNCLLYDVGSSTLYPCTSNDNCESAAYCSHGCFCRYDNMDGSTPDLNNGVCVPLRSQYSGGYSVLYNGKRWWRSGHEMDWWSAQNWCLAKGLKAVSREDIGCHLQIQYCGNGDIIRNNKRYRNVNFLTYNRYRQEAACYTYPPGSNCEMQCDDYVCYGEENSEEWTNADCPASYPGDSSASRDQCFSKELYGLNRLALDINNINRYTDPLEEWFEIDYVDFWLEEQEGTNNAYKYEAYAGGGNVTYYYQIGPVVKEAWAHAFCVEE